MVTDLHAAPANKPKLAIQDSKSIPLSNITETHRMNILIILMIE